MKELVAHLIAPGLIGATLVAVDVDTVSQVQALCIAASAGLAGGVASAILGTGAITVRGVVGRIVVSIMWTVGLLLLTLLATGINELRWIPVVGISCISGLFAWVTADKLLKAIDGLSAKEVLLWIRAGAARFFGFKIADDKGDGK